MLSKIKKTLFLSWIILLAACSGTAPGVLPAAQPLFVLADANAAPTPTPFQPIPPTPTYLPTEVIAQIATPEPTFPPVEESPTPEGAPTAAPTLVGVNPGAARTWEDYPGPTIWPDIDIPSPMGVLPHPSDQVNILLLGSDQRPNDGGFRTDTILLLTLTPSLGTANITSFPRDLYVYIPGWTVQRINTAMVYGKFDTLALTMEYNFGVTPDYYVLINLWSFKDVVDSLGGIDVNVAKALTDQRDGYGDYTVLPGIVHMDGETALWYVRARYTTSDFDRSRRQQEVILAGFERLLTLDGLTRAPQLYQLYKQNVTTNMSFDAMAQFLPLATQLRDMQGIHRFYIGPQQVYSWVNTVGSQVLVPVRESVEEVMRQALNSP